MISLINSIVAIMCRGFSLFCWMTRAEKTDFHADSESHAYKLGIVRHIDLCVFGESDSPNFIDFWLKYVLFFITIIGIYWLSVAVFFTWIILVFWFIIGWIVILYECMWSAGKRVRKSNTPYAWNIAVATLSSCVVISTFSWIWLNVAIVFVPLVAVFIVYVGPMTGVRALDRSHGVFQSILAKSLIVWVFVIFIGWMLVVTVDNGITSYYGYERHAAQLTAIQFYSVCMLTQDDVFDLPAIERWRITDISLVNNGNDGNELTFNAEVRLYTWMRIPIGTLEFWYDDSHSSCQWA